MSVYKGSTKLTQDKVVTTSIAHSLGDIVYSSIPLSNANYHLADGSILSGDGIYKDFVDFMKTKYDNAGWEWTEPVSNLPIALNSVTCGAGKFVAVGSDGFTSTSLDGVNWTTPRQAIQTGYLLDATYGNGRFVAVGWMAIAHSLGGENWSAATVSISKNWYGVTFGSGNFVAAGQSGYITTSTDGITWTTPIQVGTGTWYNITYGNGKFVAVGDEGYTTISSDMGVSWSNPVQVPLSNLNSVAYGNGKYVAISESGYSTVSTDGVMWSTPQNVGTDYLHDIIFANNKFFAVGEGVFSSVDGVTWENEFETSLNYTWLGIASDGNNKIVVANPDGYVCSYYPQNASKNYNITSVGSLINNNGVLSGFSSDNYALIPKTLSLGSNFIIQIKVTWGSDVSARQGILWGTKSWNIALGTYNGAFDFNIGNGNSWLNATYIDSTLTPNSTCWYKIVFNGSRYSCFRSTDGISFTEIAYINSTIQIPLFNAILGTTYIGEQYPFLGTIDLNESYISIGNTIVWQGSSVEIEGFTTEENWQSEVTLSKGGTCGKYAWVNSYSLNSERFIMYGTPSITKDGILVTNMNTGFIELKSFPTSSRTADYYIKCRIKDITNTQGIIDMVGIKNGYLGYWENNGEEDVFNNVAQVSINQDLYIKVQKASSLRITMLCSFDNINYESLYISVNRGLNMGLSYIYENDEDKTYYFNGEIDLLNSYFIINSVTEPSLISIQSLRLPKLVGEQQGTVDQLVVGCLTEAGLPYLGTSEIAGHTHGYTIGNESAHTHSRGTWEIKGTFQGSRSGGHSDAVGCTGAFTRADGVDAYSAGANNMYTISFTASKNWTGSTSGGTSHNHTLTLGAVGSHTHEINFDYPLKQTYTVQPETTKVLVYIVVGIIPERTKIPSGVSSALSNKANNDLSNVTLSNSIKNNFRHLCLPSSSKYIDLVVGSVGSTYTAPADGYFTVAIGAKTATSDFYYFELNSCDDKIRMCAIRGSYGGSGRAWLPVRKGDVIDSYYSSVWDATAAKWVMNSNMEIRLFRFIYADGEI